MKITQNASLLAFNTFGIDVSANYLIEYDSIEDLKAVLKLDIVLSNCILHIGSGSNLLFMHDFKGVILHSRICTIERVGEDADFVFLKAGSGVVWDNFVAYCVENSLAGVENLSLIPGEVGASAVQNIGAYGVEVQDVIEEVTAIDVENGHICTFLKKECKYGYRESVFKQELKGKYIIVSVIFKLNKEQNFKLTYQHLEQEVLSAGEINLANVRRTIIAIRESKLPDTNVMGNAGSFFMNPVINKVHFNALLKKYPQIPHYFVSDVSEKIPAGWLIDQCGWKGKQIGNVGVHDKQALVLVNRGGATGKEIVALAKLIQDSVNAKFGIELTPEVNYI